VTINQFPVLTTNSAPLGIVTGSDGNLWFTEQFANKIGQINPTTHAVAEFSVPTENSAPTFITAGPDGNLWFIESANKIGQINPTTQVITEFPIHTEGSRPGGITTGPDGNLWFTEINANQIGMINPTTHVITEFRIPTPNSLPFDITAGPDGNLWFTEGASDANKIGMINPTTHVITEFPVHTAASQPDDITAGPDGNVWFTESLGNNICEINPTTHAIAEFPTPTANSTPIGITAGPDGNVWFTEIDADQIGRVNPTTHAISEFHVPMAASSLDLGITAGPDDNIWFPSPAANTIAQAVITTTAPDLVLSGNAPASATAGSPLTYTLTVANNGTAGATGVILTDTLPAGAAFVLATGGITPVNGILNFTLGSLAAGGSTTVTVVVNASAAGPLTDTTVASMSQADPTPADNSLTLPTTITPPIRIDGPTVTAVHRFGFHMLPTTIVLTFDKPLDPKSAQNPANYHVAALDGSGRTIRINSAVYDAATRTVTLRPVQRLDLHHRFRLTVVGTGTTGVTDTSGNLLDGQETGHPGSDHVTILTGANLVLTPAEAARLRRRHQFPFSGPLVGRPRAGIENK
jgi:virginiamycin B lyase